MKKIKSLAISLGVIGAVAAPIAISISLFDGDFSSYTNYDLGIAIPPLSSMNYIRDGQTAVITPTIMQGLKTQGPSKGNLKNILQLPPFQMSVVSDPTKSGILRYNGSFVALSDFGFYAGNLRKDKSGFLIIPSEKNMNNIDTAIFTLDGIQRWKGSKEKEFNRIISSKDYISFITYIIDINSGSEPTKQYAIRQLGIKGVADVYDAQIDYSRKFGKTYKNPFAYNENNEIAKGEWESQNSGDQKFVKKIKDAALLFATEGMTPSTRKIVENNLNPEQSFEINFDETSNMDLNKLISSLDNLLPANRDFIESNGGIYKFGQDLKHFIYSSPFNIADIRLGQGGYIDLEKDENFPSSSVTLSNKIKIYFQDDANVLSSMYEDGYIGAATVGASYQSLFWSNLETRPFLVKNKGFGTVALQMNLDEKLKPNSPFLNQNFRLAIAHSINRERLIKLAGWDATQPVTSWTAKSVVTTSDGRPMEAYLDNEKFYENKASADSDSSFSVTNFNFAESGATQYVFENADRTDQRFDATLAKKYFEKFVQETGKTDVSIEFLTTGTQGVNVGLGLKSLFNHVFGGNIKVEIKSVPTNTLYTMIHEGNFEFTTNNFDYYGTSPESYVEHLLLKDEVDAKINKTQGYTDNPSGSFTLQKWYEENVINGKISEDDLKLMLDVNGDKYSEDTITVRTKMFDILKILMTKVYEDDEPKGALENPGLTEIDQRRISDREWIKQLFSYKLGEDNNSDNNISSDELLVPNSDNLFILIGYLEKLIAITSPVIPLYEVDTNWKISRIGGIDGNLFRLSLQFAYDVFKKPKSTLPGKEEIING